MSLDRAAIGRPSQLGLLLGELEVVGTSELQFTTAFADLTLRSGKIVSSRDFLSHAEGLKAAGFQA